MVSRTHSRPPGHSRGGSGSTPRDRPPPPPLDPSALERLALRYVERFATTRGRLADYLRRKLRERGWAGEEPADPETLADRMAALGYVDDGAYAEAKSAAMARRGLGARRVAGTLRAARVEADDLDAVAPAVASRATEAALAFARRRRIGPYATVRAERPLRERHLAAMVRAGHDFALARRIVDAAPGTLIEDSAGDPPHCGADDPC